MDNLIKKGTPKDVFLHLLAVLTLYVSVVAFITLWWQYINVLFPDLLQYQNYGGYASSIYDPIRWATAALMVVFPIHILISWIIGREFKTDPEKRETRTRKWLWYVTLFVSAATLIIDLIALVYNFLKGELTTQFFLKIIIILIVAGAVFGYFLWDLKKRTKPSKKPKLLAWVTSIVVSVSIIYGFFLIGTPATQRIRRFDEQRVSDLSAIQGEVVNYWQQNAKLPESLNNLRNQISGFMPPIDPESAMPYEYAIDGLLQFKLCAEFKTPSMYSSGSKMRAAPIAPGSYHLYQQDWNHYTGHTCFERTIDPKLYKLNNGTTPVPLKY